MENPAEVIHDYLNYEECDKARTKIGAFQQVFYDHCQTNVPDWIPSMTDLSSLSHIRLM